VVPLSDGANQFRLKQIDTDGKFTYSFIVSIKFSSADNINIAYSHLTHQVMVSGITSQPGTVVIYDLSGHAVYKGTIDSPVIFNPATSGIYVFNILTPTIRTSKKLMIY